MTLPFHPRPGDPDADHLNTLLDAHRSGTRAPDPASSESTEANALANAADQFRGLARRADAPAAAYLKERPLQNQWEDIMSTAFPASPSGTTIGSAFAQSAPVSNRMRRAIMPEPPHRLNAWFSAAIVAVILLGTIGGAWWLGPGGNGSNDDNRTRLAAVTQVDSTPTASVPAATYVHPQPQMCTVEPLTVDEVMAIVTGDAKSEVATPVPMPEIDAHTYDEYRALLTQYLGCEIFGDPFRAWAISSPDAVRTQLTSAPGWTPEEELRRRLKEMQAEIESAPDSSAFEWAPAGNPPIPALPDVYDPSLIRVNEEGHVHATVVWVTQDGQPPSEEYGLPIGAEDGMSEIVFVWDTGQGRWLIDGIVPAGE